MNSYVHTKFNHSLGNSMSSCSEKYWNLQGGSGLNEWSGLPFVPKDMNESRMTMITEQWKRPRSDAIWSPPQKSMFHTCYDHVRFWFCWFFVLFSFGPTFWGMFTVVRCEFVFLESCGMIPFLLLLVWTCHKCQSHFRMSCFVVSCHEFYAHFHHW